MKKNDIKYIVIFILLIVLIVGTIIFSYYKNRPLNNVDRKIEYIFNNLTYDDVLNMSENTFNNALKLVKNDFEYEIDNNEIVLYSINNYNNYKKILNYSLISNTLKNNLIDSFLNSKKIINYKGEYFIETYSNNYNNDYVGSVLSINNHGDNFVTINSTNYYCKDSKFIGVINTEPKCDYTKTESKFTLSLEGNLLKVNNLEEIERILK